MKPDGGGRVSGPMRRACKGASLVVLARDVVEQEKKLRDLGAKVPNHQKLQAKRETEWHDFLAGKLMEPLCAAAGGDRGVERDKGAAAVKVRGRRFSAGPAARGSGAALRCRPRWSVPWFLSRLFALDAR